MKGNKNLYKTFINTIKNQNLKDAILKVNNNKYLNT